MSTTLPDDVYERLLESATLEDLSSVIADPSDSAVETFGRVVVSRLVEEETLPAILGGEHPPLDRLRYEMLRFLVDEERSRIQLDRLAEIDPAFDRDKSVLILWQRIMNDHRQYVERRHFSVGYHQRRLFAWLVDRYDLIRARQIYSRSFVLSFGLQFLPILAAAVAMALIRLNHTPRIFVSVLVLGYLIPFLVWSLCGLRMLDFAQSLVPRLAGTAAAGAALLLSASDLLRFLYEKVNLGGSAVLLAAAASYLGLEIQHRVRPRLRSAEVGKRVFTVIALAMAHAAAIVIVAASAIRYLLLGAGVTPFDSFSVTQLVAFITAVFTGGLILNVIWAEEPITRPL